MMKRLIMLMLSVLLLMPICALAEGVSLDETAVVANMPCSWQQGYAPVINGNTLTVQVPVKAEGMQRVTVTLLSEDETISPLRTQGVTANAYLNGSVRSATIQAQLRPGRVNGDYRCTLLLTGYRVDGTTVTNEFPFTLHIRDGRDPGEVRPVISGVDAPLTVGEGCALTATLTNKNVYAEITNLSLKVTDTTGDILPGGTDTLLLDDIPSGGTLAVSVPLLVRPTAQISTHQLRFDLSWTSLGQNKTWQETFTLPVTQEIRLEQGGVTLAPILLQGEMATLTLPLMNMGRGELRNVVVTLEMPGITERQSVLVGTISAGETKQARVTFTPGKTALGDYAGTVTVTAEDAYGNATSFALPVETAVEAAVPLKVQALEKKEEVRAPLWVTIALGGMDGVLLLICVIQGIVMGRKLRKMEEARL